MRTREATVRRFAFTDMVFRAATLASAILVSVLLGGVAISLIARSWEALSKFGVSFLTTESSNPVTDFGALAPIYGTIVTSAVVIIIAVPIGIAIFPTELSPRPLRRPIAIAVELLAGIVTLGAEQQLTSEGCSLDGSDIMVECIESWNMSRPERLVERSN